MAGRLIGAIIAAACCWPAAASAAPAVAITVPAEGAAYAQGATVNASYTCPGAASCTGTVPSGSAIDTSTIGVHAFSVTADGVQRTVHYTVSMDRIYWSNAVQIRWANLDGSGSQHVIATDNTGLYRGLTIDSAAGRLYWADGGQISFSDLDGANAASISLPGQHAYGLAILPLGPGVPPRLFWSNSALLQGDGGVYTALAHTPTQVDHLPLTTDVTPVAVDPWFMRLYYGSKTSVNRGSVTPSGGGSGGPSIPSSNVSDARGVALDTDQYGVGPPPPGRIFWTNYASPGGSIASAPLDGGAGTPLPTGSATVDAPRGIAVDPIAGRVYWANSATTGSISWAKLDGSGVGVGGDLLSTQTPMYLALLEHPAGTAIPTVSGPDTPGTLSCTTGTWGQDLYGSFLFRAPQTLSYQWTLDGNEIPGATTSSYNASAPGDYACMVTGVNAAGATAQLSAAHTVSPAPLAPALTLQPVSRTVTDHTALVSFSVGYSGYPAPAIQWQRSIDGGHKFTDIPGATGPMLVLSNVVASMSGFRYRALGSNTSAQGIPSQVAILTVALPVLSRFGQSHARWREPGAGRHVRRHDRRLPTGTTFTFTLNEPARVILAFAALHCPCPSYIVKRNAQPGRNSFAFQGIVAAGHKLPAGAYAVSAVAEDSAGRPSKRSVLRFTIVR